uniref:Uncharacterized protein n=1 Tax=Anguilla anguilla TaxID=7936 RepID=A0A0E9X3C7_ANGAN
MLLLVQSALKSFTPDQPPSSKLELKKLRDHKVFKRFFLTASECILPKAAH